MGNSRKLLKTNEVYSVVHAHDDVNSDSQMQKSFCAFIVQLFRARRWVFEQRIRKMFNGKMNCACDGDSNFSCAWNWDWILNSMFWGHFAFIQQTLCCNEGNTEQDVKTLIRLMNIVSKQILCVCVLYFVHWAAFKWITHINLIGLRFFYSFSDFLGFSPDKEKSKEKNIHGNWPKEKVEFNQQSFIVRPSFHTLHIYLFHIIHSIIMIQSENKQNEH